MSVVDSIHHTLQAAERLAEKKVSKHGSAVVEFGGRFWPFAIESFGSFGASARELFECLVEEIPLDEFVPPNWAALSPRAYWKQVLSVALFAGQAKSCLHLRKKVLNAHPVAML